jgi:DeoR/GlpR family transcriptional regulator of sugar metabolism
VRKKILETIPDVTVLADHTKFGRKALVAVFSIAFAQCVVTNKAIPAEYLDWLTKSGVRTVIADNATKEEG